MRFNSSEHCDEFKATGQYPKIHNALFEFIAAEAGGDVFCDLGCCYGLLGHRLQKVNGWRAIGIEADRDCIGLGLAAGVAITMHHMRVTVDNLPDPITLMKEAGVNVLVCRRILPEMFGHQIPHGETFAKWCAEKAGIREVFIEGRVRTAKAVNPLDSIAKEIAMFSLPFSVAQHRGNLAHLRLR